MGSSSVQVLFFSSVFSDNMILLFRFSFIDYTYRHTYFFLSKNKRQKNQTCSRGLSEWFTAIAYSNNCILAFGYVVFSFSKSINHIQNRVCLFLGSWIISWILCTSAVLLHKCKNAHSSSFKLFLPSSILTFEPSMGWDMIALSLLCSPTSAQTFPLQPQGSALQGVRRCLSGDCQRTPPSSSSWRSSDSAVISPPYAKARRTSAISDSLRSSPWTRLSSCQVNCHYSKTFILLIV